jgi:hypothetical protein
VYSPIISLLFTISIMQTNTTGNNIPFIICDHNVIWIKGAPGINIIKTPIKIIIVNSVKNSGASFNFLFMPASKPKASQI